MRQSAQGARAALLISTLLLSACAVPLNSTRHDLLLAPGRHSLPPGGGSSSIEGALLLDVRLDRQISRNACGAHAAASLLDYWSRSVPASPPRASPVGLDLYRDSPPQSPDGYSLGQLAELLEAQGLTAVVVTTTSHAIQSELRNGRPTIVRVSLSPDSLWDRTILPYDAPVLGELERFYSRKALAVMGLFGARRINHFWVVAGFTQTHMLVLDPLMGIRQVRHDHFEQVFSLGGRLAIVSGGWDEAGRG